MSYTDKYERQENINQTMISLGLDSCEFHGYVKFVPHQERGQDGRFLKVKYVCEICLNELRLRASALLDE